MSYDLKLLAIKQKIVYHAEFSSKIIVKNEIEDEFYRYASIWPFLTNTEGIWYSLVTEHSGLSDAYAICDSDFKKNENEIEMPYWIEDEDIKYDLTPLIIREEFRADFEKIVNSIIETSPERTIMILASYQSSNKEIVCGVMSFAEYLKLLDNNKVLFNVCYIIRG